MPLWKDKRQQLCDTRQARILSSLHAPCLSLLLLLLEDGCPSRSGQNLIFLRCPGMWQCYPPFPRSRSPLLISSSWPALSGLPGWNWPPQKGDACAQIFAEDGSFLPVLCGHPLPSHGLLLPSRPLACVPLVRPPPAWSNIIKPPVSVIRMS